MKKLDCLRCGKEMRLLRREYLQLGKTGWFFGDLDNLMAGALDVVILCCPDCGKLEFYRADLPEEKKREEWDLIDGGQDRIARIKCPQCGKEHDLDDPKCPFCGEKNTYL